MITVLITVLWSIGKKKKKIFSTSNLRQETIATKGLESRYCCFADGTMTRPTLTLELTKHAKRARYSVLVGSQSDSWRRVCRKSRRPLLPLASLFLQRAVNVHFLPFSPSFLSSCTIFRKTFFYPSEKRKKLFKVSDLATLFENDLNKNTSLL